MKKLAGSFCMAPGALRSAASLAIASLMGSLNAMPSYRYFLLDGTHALADGEAIACESEAEAVVIAEQILQRRPEFGCIELWSGSRRVCRIERKSLS